MLRARQRVSIGLALLATLFNVLVLSSHYQARALAAGADFDRLAADLQIICHGAVGKTADSTPPEVPNAPATAAAQCALCGIVTTFDALIAPSTTTIASANNSVRLQVIPPDLRISAQLVEYPRSRGPPVVV